MNQENSKNRLISGKYDASHYSNGRISSNGNIKSGFKISPNPNPKEQYKWEKRHYIMINSQFTEHFGAC